MTPELQSLAARVRDDHAVGEPERLARQRDRLISWSPRRAAPPRWLSVAATLVALLGGALVLRHRVAPAPPLVTDARGRSLAPGSWIAAGGEPATLRFLDGSRVSVESGAQMRLLALSERGVELALEGGALQVEVAHRDHTRWILRSGPWSVRVTGTAFRLGWSPRTDRLEIEMRRGAVLVDGPGVVSRAVRAGEHLIGDRAGGLREFAVAAAALGEAAHAVASAEVLQAPEPSRLRPRHRARARHVATSPSEPAALEAVTPSPGALTVAPETPGALSGEADRARYEGRVGDARALLLALRARHPRSVEAHRAAHLLGVLALESQRTPAVAARWFEISLRESPQGPLHRESLGRRVQALHAAGDLAGARDAAAEYLRVDPEGAFASFARSVRGP